MKKKKNRPGVPYAFGITPADVQLAAARTEIKLTQKPLPLRIKGVIGRAQCAACGHKWGATCAPDEQTVCPGCGVIGQAHPE